MNKAEDIIIYNNPRGVYIVASCSSTRHTKAVAQYIAKDIRQQGYDYYEEGLAEGNWVLIEFENIIIHVFLESARKYYNVDELWKTQETM